MLCTYSFYVIPLPRELQEEDEGTNLYKLQKGKNLIEKSEVSQGVEKAKINGPVRLVEITGEEADTRVKPPGRAKERTIKRRRGRVPRY